MELTKKTLLDAVITCLKSIYDPEIPLNIYDLGLIYQLDLTDTFDVDLTMTLTSPNCPVAETLPNDIKERIKQIEGINDVKISITFDPPWTMEKLSEEALLELGLL